MNEIGRKFFQTICVGLTRFQTGIAEASLYETKQNSATFYCNFIYLVSLTIPRSSSGIENNVANLESRIRMRIVSNFL